MFTEFNIVVQALVWTTLAGLMYAVWLHSRQSMGKYNLGLSIQVKSVTNLLQTLWMLLALSLIISLLVFSFQSRVQSARAADTSCVPAVSAGPYTANGDQPLNPVCDQPASDAVPASSDSSK